MNMKVFFVEDSKNIKIACRTYPPHPAREGAEPELMDGYLKRYIRHHYEPVDLNLNDSLEFSCRRTRWRAIVAREARGRNSHLKADITHQSSTLALLSHKKSMSHKEEEHHSHLIALSLFDFLLSRSEAPASRRPTPTPPETLTPPCRLRRAVTPLPTFDTFMTPPVSRICVPPHYCITTPLSPGYIVSRDHHPLHQPLPSWGGLGHDSGYHPTHCL